MKEESPKEKERNSPWMPRKRKRNKENVIIAIRKDIKDCRLKGVMITKKNQVQRLTLWKKKT